MNAEQRPPDETEAGKGLEVLHPGISIHQKIFATMGHQVHHTATSRGGEYP